MSGLYDEKPYYIIGTRNTHVSVFTEINQFCGPNLRNTTLLAKTSTSHNIQVIFSVIAKITPVMTSACRVDWLKTNLYIFIVYNICYFSLLFCSVSVIVLRMRIALGVTFIFLNIGRISVTA